MTERRGQFSNTQLSLSAMLNWSKSKVTHIRRSLKLLAMLNWSKSPFTSSHSNNYSFLVYAFLFMLLFFFQTNRLHLEPLTVENSNLREAISSSIGFFYHYFAMGINDLISQIERADCLQRKNLLEVRTKI